DQSVGQLRIFSKARDNQEVLNDVRVEESHKKSIRKIELYKEYFYKYWDMKPTGHYSKTTILDSEAVSHLVIISPYHDVKAKKECFPFAGCFPYIGFFDQNDAKEYAKEMGDKGYYFYVRPVYAYSTLGYFDDPILSSFFSYSDFHLAELIFHELFHTLFFIKDNVDLNENLANYFGKEMALEYFENSGMDSKKIKARFKKRKKVRLEIVKLTNEFKRSLKESKPGNKAEADKRLQSFLSERFLPSIKAVCEEVGLKRCRYLKKRWNNASFAANLTYEDKMQKFADFQRRKQFTLKQFFSYIKEKTKEYEEKDLSEKYKLGEYLFL
ncbi:MAG: aminopeptidase, partial [Bacteriovoracaceae bacterium]